MNSIENLKNNLTKCKQEMSIYTFTCKLTPEQSIRFDHLKDKFFELKDQLKESEDQKKTLANYLRTHGEGEVVVLKKAYPATILEIKKLIQEIDKIVLNTSFYYQDGEIKQI
jgi:uncharacterized protein (DUF342 family)